jgi:hypothetical protein
LGKTSKRELELEDNNADALEVDELAFDDDIQPPTKKQTISSYRSRLSCSQSTNVLPRHGKGFNSKTTIPRSGRHTVPKDEAFPIAGPSRIHGTPLSSDIPEPLLWSGTAIDSRTFASNVEAEHISSLRDTSPVAQDAQPFPEGQPTASDFEAFGGPSQAHNVQDMFSRRTFIPADTSIPTSEFIPSSAPTYTVREYPKRRRRQAQPQWEPPNASRNKVVILPTREANEDELEVLTKASVSPVVLLRPKYAAIPRDEEKEAAMRWNLRWLSRTFEKPSGEGKMQGVSKPLLDNDGSKPVAVPEMTRSQRRDLIIDGIDGKEEELESISSEQ